MKSVATWNEGFQSTVTNERGHEIVIDLPEEQGGKNTGATALELAVMGLSGCVSTIFAMVAQKSDLNFEALKVEVNATKGPATIEGTEVIVYLKTDDAKKAEQVMEKTLKICPVGVLHEQAGVKMEHKLVIE